MLEKKEKEILTIFDSDEVDTIDSFITENDTSEDINTHNTDCKFEKIDLDKFSQELNQTTKVPKPREIATQYKKEALCRCSDLLEPKEFLEEIQLLSERREATIEKLKSMHSKCSLGIVDLAHKIEFEELSQEDGQEVLDILRKLFIYQRHIKNALEKFKSISKTKTLVDKKFTDTQLEKIEKLEDFHSSRIYSPRIFNLVERKNYPTTTLSIQRIEEELISLIEFTNSKHEKV